MSEDAESTRPRADRDISSVGDLVAEARSRLPHRPSPSEAAAAMSRGALLVDIRGDDQRRADGLIPGALCLPRNSLEWRCDPSSAWRDPVITDHDQHLILICNQGFQSSLAAATLQRLGMRHATDVAGGFVAWRATGMPVVAATDGGRGTQPADGARSARVAWDATYERRPDALSWYQPEPRVSLQLLETLRVPGDTPVLDVGGGASGLAAALLSRDFTDVTVLDVSERALDTLRAQLTSPASHGSVHLICSDLLAWLPQRTYGVWHDRALLHFFVDPEQRERYVELLRSTVSARGWVIIGVFAPDGPERCSGLPVMRYSVAQLAELVDDDFELATQLREAHITPSGITQSFQWAAFRRR